MNKVTSILCAVQGVALILCGLVIADLGREAKRAHDEARAAYTEAAKANDAHTATLKDYEKAVRQVQGWRDLVNRLTELWQREQARNLELRAQIEAEAAQGKRGK